VSKNKASRRRQPAGGSAAPTNGGALPRRPTTTPNHPAPNGGRLADVFPTMLTLMGLEQPEAMTGGSLLQPVTA